MADNFDVTAKIHNFAVVHPNAKIGKNVEIGPFTVIGENVEIDEGTIVGPSVVITGWTKIGKDCHIFQGASIGEEPQDLKFAGEKSYTVIGNRTKIHEFCTIHRATGEGEVTKIGDDCLLMAYVHVAFKAYVLQRLLCQPHALIVGHPTKRQRKRHVFKGSVVRHEVEGLEYKPHVLLPEKYKLGLVHSFKVLAVYDYLAAGHGLKPRQHVQKGGFAAAASAYYAAELPGHYLQVYSPQGMDVNASNPVYLGNVAKVNYGLLPGRFLLGGYAFHRTLLLIMPYMAYLAL